ncbi:MAG: DUF2442 domain-containing protein [Accumulibacter sp.]|jgi:hypothetical protein|uniref:DUF2442 domain-containing protein n=1 Tax=Accumulibacter sp. TaxID=2053492 RepID=UPI002FC2C2F9
MPNKTTDQEDTAAGVIPAAPWRIRAVTVLPDYRLAVRFRDGRNGIVDCSSIKKSSNPGIYGPLRDPDFFTQVRVELGALTWPNGADLDPSWLHAELADRKSWSVPF